MKGSDNGDSKKERLHALSQEKKLYFQNCHTLLTVLNNMDHTTQTQTLD